jgi:hypothetical protein
MPAFEGACKAFQELHKGKGIVPQKRVPKRVPKRTPAAKKKAPAKPQR